MDLWEDEDGKLDEPDQPMFAERNVEAAPKCGGRLAIAHTFDALRAVRFPPRRVLLSRGQDAIFRQGHLGQIVAPRGGGKSWLMETLALIGASGGEALGIHAPEPCNVLLVDGEMSSEEIQERLTQLAQLMGIKTCPGLTVVAGDWQQDYLPRLDTAEGQAFIAPFVDPADLILLDNRSTLFDSEGEKDPTAWMPAQDYILSLRRRGKAMISAHHANRQGGARGISKPEDVLNLILKLSKPEDYTQGQGARFRVEFDKARGIHGAGAAPFTAALTEHGWVVEADTTRGANEREAAIRNYLSLNGTDGARSANEVFRGVGGTRAAVLSSFDRMVRGGVIRRGSDGHFRLA